LLVKPSIYVRSLHGSAGNVTVRRHHGLLVAEPKRHSDPARLEAEPPPPPFDIIIDNLDPGWTIDIGTWNLVDDLPNLYGPDARRCTGTPTYHICRFTPDPPAPAPCNLYAWWPTDPFANQYAKFIVHHDAGDSEHYLDQTLNPGQWNLVAQYDFTPGDAYCRIDVQRFCYTYADAMRWEQAD